MAKRLTGERWLTSADKRQSDLWIAYGALVPALAATVLAASAIYIERPSAPLFKQSRMGRAGEPFNVYKVRTMERSDYDDVGNGHADNRATRIGRLLRGPGIVSKFGNASRTLVPQTDEYFRTRAEMDIDYCLTASQALDREIMLEALALGIHKLTHIKLTPP